MDCLDPELERLREKDRKIELKKERYVDRNFNLLEALVKCSFTYALQICFELLSSIFVTIELSVLSYLILSWNLDIISG